MAAHPPTPAPHTLVNEPLAAYLRLWTLAPYLFEPLGDERAGQTRILVDEKEILAVQEAEYTRLCAQMPPAQAYFASRAGVIMHDAYWLLVRDPIVFPNGTRGLFTRRISATRLDGGVPGCFAVPRLPDGRVILVLEWRHQERAWRLGLPGGFRDAQETPLQAVEREVQEETGYTCLRTRQWGHFAPDGEQVPLFICDVAPAPQAPKPDAQEAISDTVVLSLAQLQDVLHDGYYNHPHGPQATLHNALATAALLLMEQASKPQI
jgi:8-oxo-dGTP pyrophosphatase MutT (NUDIX family)